MTASSRPANCSGNIRKLAGPVRRYTGTRDRSSSTDGSPFTASLKTALRSYVSLTAHAILPQSNGRQSEHRRHPPAPPDSARFKRPTRARAYGKTLSAPRKGWETAGYDHGAMEDLGVEAPARRRRVTRGAPDSGARSLLLDAGVVSRVSPIDGVDWRRDDVIEVAAVLFEVRVRGTREAVSRLVLLFLIDVRVVPSDGGSAVSP